VNAMSRSFTLCIRQNQSPSSVDSKRDVIMNCATWESDKLTWLITLEVNYSNNAPRTHRSDVNYHRNHPPAPDTYPNRHTPHSPLATRKLHQPCVTTSAHLTPSRSRIHQKWDQRKRRANSHPIVSSLTVSLIVH